MPRPRRRTFFLRAPGLSRRLERVRKVIGGPDGRAASRVDGEERARDDDVRESWESVEVSEDRVGCSLALLMSAGDGEGRRAVVAVRLRHRVDAVRRFRAAIMVDVWWTDLC